MHCPNYVRKVLLVVEPSTSLNVDVYWDSTGGEMLDAVFLNSNNFARIVACDLSNYGNPKPYGLIKYGPIACKRLQVQGVIQTDLIQNIRLFCLIRRVQIQGLHARY
jgi:NADPH-dependent curcumin reductase CurA